MRLIQVSCAQPSIASNSSAPKSDLAHSLISGLIPTLMYEELVWGDDTNCRKLQKKASEVPS